MVRVCQAVIGQRPTVAEHAEGTAAPALRHHAGIVLLGHERAAVLAGPGEAGRRADLPAEGFLDLPAGRAATQRGNLRPAGFAKKPKPILKEVGDLPTLKEYLGK